jgi:hypothetical protein
LLPWHLAACLKAVPTNKDDISAESAPEIRNDDVSMPL